MGADVGVPEHAALAQGGCVPIVASDKRPAIILFWLLEGRLHDECHVLQALWALASVCKSTVPSRKEAAYAIVSSAKKHHAERGDAGGQRIFLHFAALSDQLYRLCHHNTSGREKMCGPFL